MLITLLLLKLVIIGPVSGIYFVLGCVADVCESFKISCET